MTFAFAEGTTGVGKTLFLTWKLWERYKKGYRVFANYRLNFPPLPGCIPPVFIDSLEELEQIRGDENRPAVAGFDELWLWLDSRDYKNKKNDHITKTIFFSRKRYVDVFYTSQRMHQVEKRIRELTDAKICPDLSCKKRITFQGREQDVFLKCTVFYYSVNPKGDGRTYIISKKPVKVEKFFTLPVMTMYNTREEVKEL